MSILLIDTSTARCRIVLVDEEGVSYAHEWQADRQLAHGLLRYMSEVLDRHGETLSSLGGIGVYRGPGSFTGLRIGLTVVNTAADTQGIPIVGVMGDDWEVAAIERLRRGDDDRLVMPVYGSDARITTPRK